MPMHNFVPFLTAEVDKLWLCWCFRKVIFRTEKFCLGFPFTVQKSSWIIINHKYEIIHFFVYFQSNVFRDLTSKFIQVFEETWLPKLFLTCPWCLSKRYKFLITIEVGLYMHTNKDQRCIYIGHSFTSSTTVIGLFFCFVLPNWYTPWIILWKRILFEFKRIHNHVLFDYEYYLPKPVSYTHLTLPTILLV